MKKDIFIKKKIMEQKKCKSCFETKNIDEYYITHPTGYRRAVCKTCHNKRQVENKKQRNSFKKIIIEDTTDIRLSPKTTKEDYETMYLLMALMGFDISKDIARQFNDKWEERGVFLNYRPRKVKDYNLFQHDGVINDVKKKRIEYLRKKMEEYKLNKNPPNL